MKLARAGLLGLALLAATGARAADLPPVPTAASRSAAIEFLGSVTLPHRLPFGGGVVGGLSGITWVPEENCFYLISDDRGDHPSAHFYRGQAVIRDGHLAAFDITGVTLLRRGTGDFYPRGARDWDFMDPNTGAPDEGYADAEAIAWSPSTRTLFWTSETKWKAAAWPRLIEARPDGTQVRALPVPKSLLPVPKLPSQAHREGARDNGDVEAIALSPDENALWLAVEEPLLQDGERPGPDNGALVRFHRLDRKSGAVLAQYAYPVDAMPVAPRGTQRSAGPGVSDIVALDADHLLVLERAFVAGVGYFQRIYVADWANASDVARRHSLIGGTPYRLMRKRLLLDLGQALVPSDNFEGMGLGPALADGRRLMLISSDDNYRSDQRTTILAFAIDIPAALAVP